MSQTETSQKPLMLIGPVGAGKSTLIKALGLDDAKTDEEPGGNDKAKKTEAITYFNQAIDTPGEMITIPHFYHALILNSVRSRLVLFLMDGQKPTQLPSRLALAMKAPVVGIISKIDRTDEDRLRKARAALTGAGVKEIIEISSLTGEGLEKLRQLISAGQSS